MVGLTDNDRLTSLPLRLGHQFLNAHDVGTGGVDADDALALQSVQNTFELPVGTDDHRVSRSQGGGVLGLADAPGGQVLHHMGVVDQVPQHPASAGGGGRLLGQVHRPLDTVAESGALS